MMIDYIVRVMKCISIRELNIKNNNMIAFLHCKIVYARRKVQHLLWVWSNNSIGWTRKYEILYVELKLIIFDERNASFEIWCTELMIYLVLYESRCLETVQYYVNNNHPLLTFLLFCCWCNIWTVPDYNGHKHFWLSACILFNI